MPRTKEKLLRKPRPNFDRDVQMAKEHLPVALGGEGKSVPRIAEERGLSTWAVYKALEQQDVKDVHQQWLKWAFRKHREMGPAVLEATEQLIRAGDSATVNNYWKRMGVDKGEPSAEVNIEKLKISAPPGLLELVRKQNPPPEAEGEYRCPACSYVTPDLAQLGDHLQAAHGSRSAQAAESAE